MDYSALIGIHDVELAATNDHEETVGCPTSASPTGLEMAPGASSVSNVCIGSSGHRGSGAEMFASAGDGLGEIFEECLFGINPTTTTSALAPSALGSNVTPFGNNESFTDFSPPNSEDFDLLSGNCGILEGNYTPPDNPGDDISHRLQPFVGELNPVTEFYAFRGAECKSNLMKVFCSKLLY